MVGEARRNNMIGSEETAIPLAIREINSIFSMLLLLGCHLEQHLSISSILK
jgi:hypothetical protein